MTPSTTPDPAPRKHLRTRQMASLGALVLTATVILFYAEENWRGQKAWSDFRTSYEKSGKSLDWKKFIPAEVPPDHNVFEAPGMKDFIREPREGKLIANAKIQPPPHPKSPKGPGTKAVEVKTSELLVAVIHGKEAAHSSVETIEAAGPAEAAAEIQKRAFRHVSAAQGFTLVSGALAKMKPFQIVLRGQESPSHSEFADLLKGFTIREAKEGTFYVLLTDVRTAEDYLASSPSVEKDLAFLVRALERPYARIPGEYSMPWAIPMPNFVKTRTTAQMLAQEAQSFLLLGKPSEALKPLLLINKLGLAVQGPTLQSTTLVGAMIRTALAGLYVAVVEDGFRLSAWGDAELQEIARQASDLDLIRPVIGALNNELAGTTYSLPQHGFSKLFDVGGGVRTKVYALLPKGWMYQNMGIYGRLMQDQIASLEAAAPLVDPPSIAKATAELERELDRSSPFILLARVAIPNTSRAIQTVTRNSTMLRLATVACALERYRLSHGAYPERLADLIPQFISKLPKEMIGGGDFHYNRSSPNDFLLYSVGWNGADDGGQTSSKSDQGDWVWLRQ